MLSLVTTIEARAQEFTRACAGSPMPGDRVPLVALMNRGAIRFAAEFDARLRDSEFCSLSLAHSHNVLRHLGAGPRRASALVGLGNVSKQALSQQIAQLERDGYVEALPDPSDARARLLTLTPKGERAQALVHALFVEIEEDWAAQIGSEDVAALRRVLTALATAGPNAC